MRERQPGVWELRVRAGRDPLTGKHRQISRTFRGSGRQASKALARLVTEAQDGSHAGSDKTVGELLDRWIDHLEARGRTPKTIDGYRSLARARLEPALGTVKLRRLTPVQLDDLYQSLLGAGLSPVYVRHCHAALSTALRQAVKWDWIDRSPAERATPPGAMPPEVSPPDAEGISRLISAVEKVDPDMASMLFVAATTGCRRGELCGLRWSDLEVDKATVTVRRSISDTSRGVEVKDPKTHRARRISLDAATVSVLTTHHERVEQRARDIGSELSSEAYIWSQEGDSRTPWKPDRVTDAFRTHRKRADLSMSISTTFGISPRPRLPELGSTSGQSPSVWGTRTPRSRCAPMRTSSRQPTAKPRKSWGSSLCPICRTLRANRSYRVVETSPARKRSMDRRGIRMREPIRCTGIGNFPSLIAL